jgi:hypothetical protein
LSASVIDRSGVMGWCHTEIIPRNTGLDNPFDTPYSSPMTQSHLLTRGEVAREVGVTWQAVTSRITNGTLKAVRVQGELRISRAECDRWKQERRQRAAAMVEAMKA